MRCEELEAIVFSGREITAEERAEMEAHAKTCEACRALMDNADALRGMQRIDENVTPPESFTKGWRMAIRQTPRVISISDWMRRKGVRVVGSDGWAETKKTRRGRPTITTTALMIPTKPIHGRMRSRFTRTALRRSARAARRKRARRTTARRRMRRRSSATHG